jgi:hypothetical protein
VLGGYEHRGLSWATARRWLLYIAVALFLIGLLLGFFFYMKYRGISDELVVKWMNISLTASLVFGYSAKKFWQYRRRWTFWAELGVLVVAHFALLGRLEWQQAKYFSLPILIGFPEAIVVYFLLGLMFEPNPDLSPDDLQK